MPPRTRSKRATPQARTLPPEIIYHVVASLDPILDRPTLATVMRASSSLWEVAAKQLYTNLTLDTLESLLASAFSTSTVTSVKAHSRYKNRDLTPRARRALAMTSRLVLGPEQGCAGDLVDAKVIGGPLFPNVTSLLLVDESNIPLERHADDYAPNIVLFDRPDMCIKTRVRTLSRLGVGNARTLSFHGYPADSIISGYLGSSERRVFPSTWEEFRVFDAPAPNAAPATLPNLDRRWKKDAGFPPVKVRFAMDEAALNKAFKGYHFKNIIEDKDMGACKLCGQS